MNYIQRSIETRLLQAMKAYKAVLVTGPRQAGKSTLLKQLFPARKYVSLDDPFLEEQANQNGSTFMMLNQPPITIDEAQRAPMLFSYIKMRCDESEEKGLFCLSGSQQFRLMKNVSETLAGRVWLMPSSPFAGISAPLITGLFAAWKPPGPLRRRPWPLAGAMWRTRTVLPCRPWRTCCGAPWTARY